VLKKSVVMIAHSFPPEGSAGVFRPLRFAKCLPELGWRPTVVSCEKDVYERYDPGLLALIGPDVAVRRVKDRDPWQRLQARRARRSARSLEHCSSDVRDRVQARWDRPARAWARRLVRRVESWCYHPDMAMGWITPTAEEVVRLRAEQPIDIIYATAGPLSAFVAAYKASRQTGVPYVLDFRDAWTITHNDFDALRPAWVLRRDRSRLARMLSQARAIIFRYQAEAECYWRAYSGSFAPSAVHIIPNGFDGVVADSPIPGGDTCNILYTGTLSSYRYDTVIEALCRLKRRNPAGVGRLSLVFVGEGAEAMRRDAAAAGLSDVVQARNPVTFAQATDLHRTAHALLALGRPSNMKGFELFAGAKVFEYLKAGRPIIGCLPDDETRKVLARVRVSTVADIDNASEIASVFETVLSAWSEGRLASLLPDRSSCELYSADQQTLALVRALDGAAPVEPFTPGAVEVPLSLKSGITAMRAARSFRTTAGGSQKSASTPQRVS
jgi:glycosyltransferase involved in cell wall biosynthesis